MKTKISVAIILLVSTSAFGWWSTVTLVNSTHHKMTNDSRGLLASSYYDVKTKFGTDITNWTSGPGDDAAAHGMDASLNGGPIDEFERRALEKYKSGNFSSGAWSAYYYTALMVHLIEDQAVPAHASEILHGSIGWMDNMEELAYWNYSPAAAEVVLAGKPTDSYYEMKFYMLDTLANNSWTANYWIPGEAGVEGSGSYAGPENAEGRGTDVFPPIWEDAGEQERGLMQQVLGAGVGHAAGGLLAASKMLPPLIKTPVKISAPIINTETGNIISFKIIENRSSAVNVSIVVAETGQKIIDSSEKIWNQSSEPGYNFPNGAELPYEKSFSINWKGKVSGAALADGNYTLQVLAQDSDGNVIPVMDNDGDTFPDSMVDFTIINLRPYVRLLEVADSGTQEKMYSAAWELNGEGNLVFWPASRC